MKNRVLIIDHDKVTCKEIKYSLASDTMEAYYCLTLREGLTELTQKDYEAVILNISFPESDGMEPTRAGSLPLSRFTNNYGRTNT